jgi:DNA-binding GntR family transcriptional regulator
MFTNETPTGDAYMPPKKQHVSKDDASDTVDTVFQAIRHRIHAGRLVAGQRLVEADLVGQLHSSRGRVREAFRRLESEGLVQIDRNKGASVRRISREEISQTMEVMEVVSLLIIEKAISRREEAAVQKALRRALDRVSAFRRKLDDVRTVRELMDENARFWDVFDELQGNPVLSSMRRRLEATFFRLYLSGLGGPKKERWITRHEEIIVAVLKGDRTRAKVLVRLANRHVFEAMLALPDVAFANS